MERERTEAKRSAAYSKLKRRDSGAEGRDKSRGGRGRGQGIDLSSD